MSASENQLSFTRAALKPVALQNLLFVPQAFPGILLNVARFCWRAGRGAVHHQFEEHYYV